MKSFTTFHVSISSCTCIIMNVVAALCSKQAMQSMAKNKWTDDELAAAMEAVRVETRGAARKFGIHASTLSDHLNGKY